MLDVGVPGLDGLQLLEAIRAREGMAAMPAVFLSAPVMPEDVQKGRDMRAIYLTKPFVTSTLSGAVDKALAEADVEAIDPGGW